MKKYCCEVFPKIATGLSWMSYTNDNKESILCMPYIEDECTTKYRVNYCPSCGSEIRSIEINALEFSEF